MRMNSDFVYPKALLEVRNDVIKKNCYGCLIDHPSQTQHDCIMSDFIQDDEQAIDFYLEERLAEEILLALEDTVQGLNVRGDTITQTSTFK